VLTIRFCNIVKICENDLAKCIDELAEDAAGVQAETGS
jgi:hypothetical protein